MFASSVRLFIVCDTVDSPVFSTVIQVVQYNILCMEHDISPVVVSPRLVCNNSSTVVLLYLYQTRTRVREHFTSSGASLYYC
jgi:hypothetical protein